MLIRRASVLFVLFAACSSGIDVPPNRPDVAQEASAERVRLQSNLKTIAPFFKPMDEPQPGDWLASHKERGETFDEYLDAGPARPTADRQKIYVLPLGRFDRKQLELIGVVSEFLGIFFDLPVQTMKRQDLVAAGPNVRHNKSMRSRQIKTGHILNDLLKPRLPGDAAALISFTNDDLYPDESMNYVFGQASLEHRVGVWSLARLDDNTTDQNFLARTLKIAAHETGHMFSMRHCTKYECLMSGTNHLGETDRRPLDACAECTTKICWLSEIDQAERYKKLAEFFQRIGMRKEAADFKRKQMSLN